MNQGVVNVKLQPDVPCLIDNEYNAGPDQQLYFFDLRRNVRKCSNPTQNFKQLNNNSDKETFGNNIKVTEYDLIVDNGMKEGMQRAPYLTYSFFPNFEAAASDVQMNFYQIPTYHYKLECHEDYRRNIGSFLRYFEDQKDEQSWFVMFNYFNQLGIAGLCIIVGVPIVTGKATIVFGPLACLTAFVMLAVT